MAGPFGAPAPPATSTPPSGSSVAVCPLRVLFIVAANEMPLVAGSKKWTNAVSAVEEVLPPARRTLPFNRRVPVKSARGLGIKFPLTHEPGCAGGAAVGDGLELAEGDADATGDDAGLGGLVLTRGPLAVQ